MRGRIKGTDSTINAILATAVLYELRWKIWNCAGKIQFVIKTVMTNTVEFTEWSELLNHATNPLRHRIYARILREFLNLDVVSKPDKALGYASCLISFIKWPDLYHNVYTGDPLLVADAMVLQDEAEWMLSNTEPPHSAVHAKLDQLAMQEDGMVRDICMIVTNAVIHQLQMVILLSILPQSHLTVADTSTPAEPISGHTENSKLNAPHFIMNWLEQNLQATPQTTPTTKPHPQETESSAKVVCETFWSLSPDLLAGIAAQSVDFFRFFYKALSHRVNQLQTELLEPGGGTESGVCPERFEREAACYFRSLMAVNESVREVTVALVESQVEETAVKVLAVGMKTSGKCGSGDQCERFTPCSAAKLPFNLWRTVLATAHRE